MTRGRPEFVVCATIIGVAGVLLLGCASASELSMAPARKTHAHEVVLAATVRPASAQRSSRTPASSTPRNGAVNPKHLTYAKYGAIDHYRQTTCKRVRNGAIVARVTLYFANDRHYVFTNVAVWPVPGSKKQFFTTSQNIIGTDYWDPAGGFVYFHC